MTNLRYQLAAWAGRLTAVILMVATGGLIAIAIVALLSILT